MAIGDGRYIALQFSQPLTGDVSGLTPSPVGGSVHREVDMSLASVTTLNQYSSYAGTNAVDGSTSTYWRGTTAVNWISMQFQAAKRVTKLRMYLGSYYISTFTLSGSNDGTTWTQIGGTYTAASSTTAQWYEFTIDNETAYLHYRINTLTAYSTTRIYIYELELYETVQVGNEGYFTVTVPMYDMVPGGTLSNVVVPVVGVSAHPTIENTILLEFGSGSGASIQNAAGDITVAYAGGNLMGTGGPVAPFSESFTPQSLIPKPHQNDEEHIEVDITASSTLLHIYYTNTLTDNGHIEIAGITATGTLTNINDL